MIVEDEALLAMHLETVVVSLGHEVCAVATTAAEAVARAAECCPDVTVMDIRLADGSSGIDAAREMYARQSRRCIFLSANLDEATRETLRGCEPIAFVSKPVSTMTLQQALEHPSLPRRFHAV
jgi:DNA-binding NarL/FixJ family response regulator